MTTVAEIVQWLERFAPPALAEPWDNVGLLWGDPSAQVGRVMTCLTVTRATAEEAIAEHANLIVSHHPILFHEVKKIRADMPSTSFLWHLARSAVAIASPHTAFDSTSDGINDGLCRRLGLSGVLPLRPLPAPASFKIVVFTPESDREAVLSSAFEAGAGRIGAYTECSFATAGQGTFFGSESTHPSVGEKGRRETVDELRLEFVCPGSCLAAVLSAIRAHHSYEEPAIDVFPLHNPPSTLGSGRIGQLRDPRPLEEFAQFVSRVLGDVSVQFAGDPRQPVRRVAVACGAGDDFLADAALRGADVLVTGEARFHRVLDAESRDIGIVLAGHYSTERPGVEELAERIARAFPDLTVWPSQQERDPMTWAVRGGRQAAASD